MNKDTLFAAVVAFTVLLLLMSVVDILDTDLPDIKDIQQSLGGLG